MFRLFYLTEVDFIYITTKHSFVSSEKVWNTAQNTCKLCMSKPSVKSITNKVTNNSSRNNLTKIFLSRYVFSNTPDIFCIFKFVKIIDIPQHQKNLKIP